MVRSIIGKYSKRKMMRLLPTKLAILGGTGMVGIDVGSAGGLQPHWRAYNGVVDFYLFEPHQESFQRLHDLYANTEHGEKYHVLPIGLSGTGGERTLYMLNAPTGSSLYPVNMESEFADPKNSYIYPIREVKIQTRKLSDVLDEGGVDNVDIIKLDVQGAELEILQGMGNRRKTLLLAEVEVNISSGVTNNIGPYQSGPTWGQIDELLTADGMRLLDVSIARIYRGKNGDVDWYQREKFDVYENSTTLSAKVWEADVVYVRDWRQLVANGDGDAIRKLVVALCGYRFFSEAYYIVEQAGLKGIFDLEACNHLKQNITDWHMSGRYPWHGRGIFWRTFRRVLRATRISQLLRWKQYMWFEYPNG